MKPTLCTCALLLLCACATPPEITIPEVPQLPEGWGRFDSSRFEGGDCPALFGNYLSTPDEFEKNSKTAAAEKQAAFLIYKLFPFHLSESREVPGSEVTVGKGLISVRQPSSSLISVENYVEAKATFERTTFSMTNGDFSCTQGVLKFPRSDYYAMMEGQNLNFQVQVQARKAEDGSLIMIWSRGPYRGKAPDKAEFVQVFYRFRPAAPK